MSNWLGNDGKMTSHIIFNSILQMFESISIWLPRQKSYLVESLPECTPSSRISVPGNFHLFFGCLLSRLFSLNVLIEVGRFIKLFLQKKFRNLAKRLWKHYQLQQVIHLTLAFYSLDQIWIGWSQGNFIGQLYRLMLFM